MKKIALFVMVMAVAVAGLSFAQAKPDFSGSGPRRSTRQRRCRPRAVVAGVVAWPAR